LGEQKDRLSSYISAEFRVFRGYLR